ncbi:MAG: beta-ketoacyl-ACP synthase III [Phycisphaeraceae bacterium]
MTRADRPRPAGVRIAGTGVALPERTLTNHELAALVDTNDDWITKRTGIKTRRIVDGAIGVVDLAAESLQGALASAGMLPTELDMVLVATLTPEMACPSTAARVTAMIGAQPAGAMDLSAACSGFVYGLNLAATLVESGQYRTVAVVGAEVLSKITDWTDRRTCILFGDGAGAAIVTASDDAEQGCLYQTMRSDGRLWAELYLPREAKDVPEQAAEAFSGTYNTLQMNGREVFKFAVNTTQAIIDETLEAAGVKAADLAMMVPHQSNRRILEAARERLGLPPEKVWINIDAYGNTSAASVPICLHEMQQAGKVGHGDLVMFMAIGGGMTWASSLWRF